MKPVICKKTLLPFVLVIIASLSSFAQQTLWVGQSYTFDVSSSVTGITANMSWSTNGGYLSLSGSGFYRTITVTQYFSGTATVTCEWDYKLTGNGSYTHTKRQVTISCRDNQVSISPTSMTMSPGETRYVSYRHQYDNQYTSAANAYFQSSDPSICTVSSSGEVTAKKPGTAYINVYSKISSVAPYCRVTIEKVSPTAIFIPSSLEMTGGDVTTLHPTLTPSNAQANLSWNSSNTSVAIVNDSGQITAIKAGTAVITVNTDNGLSSSCSLIVNKGKLEIFSNIPSGWVEKDTQVILSASQPNAIIYYTIDESDPTSTSEIYSSPFILHKNHIIKAYASCDGFYDSDVKTFKYDLRDFVIQQYFPQENQTVHRFSVPYITFNQQFDKGTKFDRICFKDNLGNDIPFTLHIGENQLFISPTHELEELKGYHIVIPEQAICSKRNEYNKEITLDFNTGTKIVCISYGYENCAIVKSDGSLWVWGRTRYGQLGNGETSDNVVQDPIKIMDDVEDVQMSYMCGLALKTDGSVWSWGRNDSGYLGCGNKTNQPTPVQILSGMSKIYLGESTSAAIDNNGSLYMWGSNYYGQIGDGTNSTALSPKKILSNVNDVAVRYNHTAAIVNGSSIYGWGHNCHKEIFTYGSYGNGVEVKTPFRFGGYSGSAVATTEGNTIFLNNGTVNICGINYNGIFGNGMTDSYITQGMQTPISNIKEIKSAQYYILALKNDKSLWGWGDNEYGQIGAGHYRDVTKPYNILSDIDFFFAGYRTAAAIQSNGDVYAWGNNNAKQLLGASSDSKVSIPVKIFNGPANKPLESVRLICSNNCIAPKANTLIVPIINPIDAKIANITWSCSNYDIASVDKNGVVSAIAEGSVDISAKIEDQEGNIWNSSIEITVDSSASIKDTKIDDTTNIYSNNNCIFVKLAHNVQIIALYDISGRLISSTHKCSYTEFHDLLPGIYIVKINNLTYKIVVK